MGLSGTVLEALTAPLIVHQLTQPPGSASSESFRTALFDSGLVQAKLHGQLGLLHILHRTTVWSQGARPGQASFACSRLAEAESLSPKRRKIQSRRRHREKPKGVPRCHRGCAKVFHSVPVSLALVSSPLQLQLEPSEARSPKLTSWLAGALGRCKEKRCPKNLRLSLRPSPRFSWHCLWPWP